MLKIRVSSNLRKDQSLVIGVCAGFENASKINKSIWRIAFVITTVVFPCTVIIYTLLAFFAIRREKASVDQTTEDVKQIIVIDESVSRDEMQHLRLFRRNLLRGNF